MNRPPAVAGRFYPGEPRRLREAVDELLVPSSESEANTKPLSAMACVVPHAGYIYSGRVAGEVFRRVAIPKRVILIGPRHYPRGASAAILSEGAWETPLGDVPLDSSLASKIVQLCPFLREDEVAHSNEHSLEVQLPFLQRLTPSFSFVPIVLGPVNYEHLEMLGQALADVIRSETEPVLIVASSDMNHYESDSVTRVKDKRAIDRILEIDPRGLFDTVRREEITMCGYAAVTAMLVAARTLGAHRATLIGYATSGEVNGDLDQVVGYAGIIV